MECKTMQKTVGFERISTCIALAPAEYNEVDIH